MNKANLFVVGCQKGGTTYIHDLLDLHPEIKMSKTKELHFFDSKDPKLDYIEYNKNFDFDTKYRGESTPSYMYIDEAMKRLYRYNSKAKIIVLLRNPVSRAFSQFNMEAMTRNLAHDFSYYLKNERMLARRSLPYRDLLYSFVDRGIYSEQIRRIKRFFADEQILILKSEQLFSHPQPVIRSIYKFLELQIIKIDTNSANKHERAYKRKMSQNERSFLRKHYETDIKEVEKMLGWDCSDWC